MSDVWLAQVAGAHHVAFVGTQPCWVFIEPTFRARFGMNKQFEWPDWQSSGPETRSNFERWLSETTADALVVLEVPPDSPEFIAILDQPLLRTELPHWLEQQNRFHQTNQIEFPEHGCVVTIWRKTL